MLTDSNPAATTPDWSSSYSHYLTRSAAQSAKTLKLYQEALESVSQGKLAPTIFQDQLPAFIQAHSQDYTAKVSEVGAVFLSDLMRVGISLQQHADSELSAANEAEIVPPRFDTANPARWFQQLAEYAGQLNARALKAYRAQLDRVAAGETTPTEVQQTASDYLAHRAPEYLQQLTQLYLGLLNGLNDLRAEYEESYFRGVLGAAHHDDSGAPPVLSLTGLVGTTASASLSVTNTTAQRAAIRYLFTDVRRADGAGPAFDPKVSVTPAVLELGPDEEGTLTLLLHLEAGHYDPGAPYIGTLYVTGGADLRVEVRLRITAIAAK